MAMLAEPKSRKRKFVPASKNTNANWAQDSNSIGLKLIQKMGWSEGEGLGVDGNGQAEPLHISYKFDYRGLGCLNKEGDIAVAQQRNFEEFLSNLSQENAKPDEPAELPEVRETKSLESMSQKSRSRVHYHKFTRGKDLSRASSKDLASILGIPDTQVIPIPNPVPAVGPQIEDPLLKSSGSSVDYFKKLRQLKKKKTDMELTENVNNKEEKSSADSSSDDENNSPSNTSILNSTQVNSTSKERRKSVTWGDVEVSFVSKYIKDMADTSSESVNDASSDLLPGTEAMEESLENGCDKKTKKKKKKNKNKNKDEPLEDTISSNVDSVTECVDDCSEIRQKKKKKKKEIQAVENSYDTSLDSSTSLGNSVEENGTLKERKKKSKDKNRKVDESLSTFETSENNVDTVEEIVDLCSEKGEKKKKRNKDIQEVNEHVTLKEKKKKSKDKHGKLDESTTTLDSSEDTEVKAASDDGKIHKSLKEKKKKKKNSNQSGKVVEVIHLEDKEKSKKKRKQTEDESDNIAPVKKKTKRHEESIPLEPDVETSNISTTEPSSQPALSALTLERMEKWKKRKQAKEDVQKNAPLKTNENEPVSTEGKKKKKSKKQKDEEQKNIAEENPSTLTLVHNPALTVQSYNHKRVLAALGYDVKNSIDSVMNITIPPTEIPGSNLDFILGYGEGLKC